MTSRMLINCIIYSLRKGIFVNSGQVLELLKHLTNWFSGTNVY